MDTKLVLDFIKQLLPYVPMAVQGITTAKDIVVWGFDSVGKMIDEDRDPTDEEWAQLNKTMDEVHSRLMSDDI